MSVVRVGVDGYGNRQGASELVKGNFIVHAHHSCGGKRGKLSGSKFASIHFSDILMLDGNYRIFWIK